MKTWDWKQAFTAELKLWVLEAAHQLFGYRLTSLQRHILRERAKMTRTLWLRIMWRDNWKCKIRSPFCPGRANQVDHIIPVSQWGYTVEENLQAAAEICNKWKSNRIL